MVYKGVIFDMDGLLFDTESLYCQANLQLAPKYGLEGYDEAYYMQYVGISDEELHQAYYRDFATVSKEVIDQFISEGFEVVKELFLTGLASLKPGVVELLTALKNKKIPCVVASSNQRHFIDILLEQAKIRDYFIDIISVEDVKQAKPDPEIVTKAVTKLGLNASDCLMLEDSYNGVEAAYRAKVPVIMVPDLLQPTTEVTKQALIVLNSLIEVQAFLEL